MPPQKLSRALEPLVREPVYQQLARRLHLLIREGEFPPRSQFLTEREVGKRFAVSRPTANKALAHLMAEGALEFRKGLGSFVNERVLDNDLQTLVSFTRRALLAGKKPTTRVLKFATLTAQTLEENIQAALGVKGSDALFYVERLRLADGTPVILEKRYMVGRMVGRLTREQMAGSFYQLLTETLGLKITGAEQTIRALNLAADDARWLLVKPGTAALWLHGMGSAGVPLWLENTVYRGDRYEFQNMIGTERRSSSASLVICKQPFNGV